MYDSPMPPLPSPPPPPKQNIRGWWNQLAFSRGADRKPASQPPYRDHDSADHPVFGKPLKDSLRYASVQISTANAHGDLYVWGYIPVVVAKCGLYLKESATEVAGTFRVNGSTRRMRDLQAAFESPPRYGKSLDWKQEAYTTHDVASVFRRYLTQMPEPVIPYDMYHHFRDALAKEPFNQEEVITTYKALIRRLPRANQYLLLYVLDLLSVFARKSDKNLMTATNLAVIFRPGLISHPQHEMSPPEHALSQRVLEFLIAQQDWFMLDIAPPPLGEYGIESSGGGSSGGHGGGGGGGGGGGKWREGTPSRQGTGASYDSTFASGSGPAGGGNTDAEPLPTTPGVRMYNLGPGPSNLGPGSGSGVKTPVIIPNVPTFVHSTPIPSTPPPAATNKPSTAQTQLPTPRQSHSRTPSATPPQRHFVPQYVMQQGQGQGHSRHGSAGSTSHSQTQTQSPSGSSSSHPNLPLQTDPPPPSHPKPPQLHSHSHPHTRFSITSFGSGSDTVDDIMIIPSSDEEFSALASRGSNGSVGLGFTTPPQQSGWLSRGIPGFTGAQNGFGSGRGRKGGGFMSGGKDREKKEMARVLEQESIKNMRRRTTIERSELTGNSLIAPALESPSTSETLGETLSTPIYAAEMGVRRSRTMPSSTSRRKASASVDETEDGFLFVTTENDKENRLAYHLGGGGNLNLKETGKGEKRVLKKQRRGSRMRDSGHGQGKDQGKDAVATQAAPNVGPGSRNMVREKEMEEKTRRES